MERADIVVIGGGPGGLAAAAGARAAGAGRVLVLERAPRTGGILNQCIHDGFGLVRYKTMLTGPEYAKRARAEAQDAGVEVRTGAMVTDLSPDRVVTAVTRSGLLEVQAGAVVLATGCRERTRGALGIPGDRPAGVYTAGAAQDLINVRDLMIGRRVVVLGSGDIGLIMARRLTLEGAQVLGVAELRQAPGALERNVQQCLYDFGIPLWLGTTVTEVLGRGRVEGVVLAQVGPDGRPRPETARTVPCDTLLLSVGLIPENEVSARAGAAVTAANGLETDDRLRTTLPGVFACGNCRRVMDLADFVTVQGLTAGANAARWLRGEALAPLPPETSNAMAKGLPQPGVCTCICCPKGCRIAVAADGTTQGNACPKGETYARQEQRAPQRVLTTTVKDGAGRLVPVKTERPIARAELLRCARAARGLTWPDGAARLTDPFGLGVDLIAP